MAWMSARVSGGQADHEIEFDLLPARANRRSAWLRMSCSVDALVDHVAQALGGGLGGHGGPGAPDAGHDREHGVA
jgi:hypothetical protein